MSKEDWKKVQVGEICEVGRGSSPRPINDSKYFDGGDIPWIKIADATKSQKYLYETNEYVNEYGASFSRLLPKGSLIIAASGTLGYTQRLGVEGCIHDGWLYLNEFSDQVDVDFLYYLFKHRVQYFYNSAYGAAIQNVNTTILREMEIELPPIDTQNRIASILSAFDDLIENNSRRIEILEEMARRIYREWFVHFHYPGHENDELVDSGTELGEIPEGWEGKKLKDFLNFKNGKSPETKEGEEYPVYGSNGIIGKCNEPGWEDGVIIGRVGAYCGSVEYCEGKFWGSDNTIVATTREEYDFSLFAYYKLEDLNLRRYAGGSAQPLMTQTVIKDIKIAIPHNDLLKQFSEQARELWKFKRNLEKKNEKLKETRDLLLPKLISGKVDVEELHQIGNQGNVNYSYMEKGNS